MRKHFYHSQKRAFTLIETVLALAIVGGLLVSVFGLMGVAISANQAAVAQTGAANVLSGIVADIHSASNTATATQVYQISLPVAGAATASNPTQFYLDANYQMVAAPGTATYQVNYWTTGSTATCQESMIRVLISWPASALYTNPKGSVETVVVLNRIQ